MRYGILFFPEGSAEDPKNQSGLHHLFEHYFILKGIRHQRVLHAGQFQGMTNPLFFMIGFQIMSDRFSEDEIFRFFQEIDLGDSAIFEQSKLEVLEEIKINAKKIKSYEHQVKMLTNSDKFPSPAGKKDEIQSVKQEDFICAAADFSSPIFYEFDTVEKNFPVKVVEEDGIKFQDGCKDREIISLDEKIYLPVKPSPGRSVSEYRLCGIMQELLQNFLYEQGKNCGVTGFERLFLSWEQMFLVMNCEISPENFLSKPMNEKDFLLLKEGMARFPGYITDSSLSVSDFFMEVISQRILRESRIYSSGEEILSLLDQVSYEMFLDYLREQEIEGVWFGTQRWKTIQMEVPRDRL